MWHLLKHLLEGPPMPECVYYYFPDKCTHRFQDSIRRLRAFLAARLLERKSLLKDVARSKAKLLGSTRYAFEKGGKS